MVTEKTNIRGYHPDDFTSYCNLVANTQGENISNYLPLKKFLERNLRRPRFSPQRDLLLAEKAGELVGFLEINPEPQIGRAVLEGAVHPSHRRQGVGTQLLEQAIERAKDIPARCLHVNLPQPNRQAKVFLSRREFYQVRRFWEMKSLIKKVPVGPLGNTSSHTQLHLRHLQKGEEDDLAQLQNHCFMNTWGFHPNTGEDIRFRLNLYDSFPHNIILLEVDGFPAAYCWAVYQTEKRFGHILMLGVAPEHREKGLGKVILGAGIRYLQNNNISVLELTADSFNLPAIRLYQAFGFRKKMETCWYELRLP